MKNLTKIFMMVAALFAFACTTDVTEDLGVQLGDGAGQTTITLSLEESRTQLGEKVGELYPLYWSEGDAIAANGVASNSIADEWVGKSGATFTFEEDLSHPYHIVYPAPAEGVTAVTEGCYPVVFPAVQKYVAGNIDGAAAVMYGYAEEGSVPTLNHLTGILRFAVKGDVTLASMVVIAEKGALSGTYDVNCATGALTVQEGSTGNSVSVSFGDGLKLSAEEASLIHVAVPAGEYGIVSVMLNTVDDQHMYAKFNSDGDKKVNAGKVREFTGFTFEANSEVDTVIFEISDVATLKKFAELVATDKFYPRTEAKLVAPIDMTGEEWTPIDNFSYTFNGNNQTITGLTEPLFGTVSANIKNLTLANVNIASNGRLVLGAVACVLSAGDNSKISNCKVSGTITVSNPDTAIASDADKYTTIDYGGVVGIAYCDVTDCVNEANITVNQIAKSDNTVVVHPNIGGIVAYSVTGAVTNCVNGNEAKTTGAINYHDNQKALLYVPSVAGIVGLRNQNNSTDLTGNKNYGAISFKANSAGNNDIDYDSSTIGGIVGYTKGNVQNNDNYGTITVADCDVKALYIGGAICIVSPSTPVKENHNHTGADISVGADVTFHCLTVAGTIAGLAGGLADADGGGLYNCSNDGTININASTASDIELVSSNYYRIGGVVGYINRAVNGCENKANGDITLEGDVVLTRSNAQSGYNVAGVYAYHSTDASHLGGNTNHGDINVYTNVSKHTLATESQTTYYKLDIGGIGAHTQRPLVDKEENFGNITIGKADGTKMDITANNIYIAGGVAQRYNRTNGVEGSVVNHGDITINSGVTLNSSTLGVYIGGCAAGSRLACDYHNYTNNGDITIKGTITDISYIGGVIGYSEGPMTDCTNTGAITTASTSNFGATARIAGVAGHVTGTLNTVKNNAGGDLNIEGNFDAQTHFAGVTGYFTNTLTSCENHGNITFNATTAVDKALYIAGIIGEYYTSDDDTIVGKFTDCINTGDIAFNKCNLSTGDIYVNIAGIASRLRKATTFTNCSNSGTISTAKSININCTYTIGGIVGGSGSNITFDNCHNSMKVGKTYGIDIQHTIKAGTGSNQCRVGGLIGWQSSGVFTSKSTVSNSADIYIACINNESGGSSYGGFAGVLGGSAHSFGGTLSNSGDIIYEGTSPSGTFSIGGLCGQSGNKAPALCENLINTGDITITNAGGTGWKPTAAKKNGMIGGIMGIHSVALSNAKFYGTITAIGFEDDHGNEGVYNAVGGIIGSVTSANLSNCHIGGTFVFATENKTDEEGYDSEVQTPGKLSVDNYAAYLSGDHTFTSAAAKSQSCGYISAIDATAEYAK